MQGCAQEEVGQHIAPPVVGALLQLRGESTGPVDWLAQGLRGSLLEVEHFDQAKLILQKVACCPDDGCAYRELHSSVAMMQATDHGLHNDATEPFDWSADRRILG